MSTTSDSRVGFHAADPTGDEVVIAGTDQRWWVAWSRATLDSESVVVADASSGPEPIAELEGFRPCAASDGDRALVACHTADRRVLVLTLSDSGAVDRWELAAGAPIGRVAVTAASGDRLWWAWQERDRDGYRLILARTTWSGEIDERLAIDGKGTWLGEPALAWADDTLWVVYTAGTAEPGGRVVARHVVAGELSAPHEVATDAGHPSAASIAIAAGGAYIAWHSRVAAIDAEPVLRWLRASFVPAGLGAARGISPPVDEPQGREHAGEDQGWEMPAIAVGPDGALWLAGRSSHGFWYARRPSDGAWSARAAISTPGWGGRGTRLSLAVRGGEVVCARREPDGVTVSALEAPPDALAAATPVVFSRAPSRPAGGPMDVLFGDLHRHSAHSDGCGTAEDLWSYAVDRGLDFAALTDHDRFCRRSIGPLTWGAMCELADAFDAPGHFVALPGYEFTGARHPGPGHKCVYFGDDRPDRVPDKNVDALYAALREHGGIAVPHHVGWTGTGADHHDPELQPVWELCSVHGCYECHEPPGAFPPRDDIVLAGHFVRDALDANLRFGFIASTDSHGLLWHHGIARKRDPFATGLAAVVGASHDRGGILDAIRARRTYATTGARIALQVELDGAPMGSELPADARGHLSVRVQGTAELASITAVTPDGDIPLEIDPGASCETGISVSRPSHRPWSYVYIRVAQRDDEMAWSSPIWMG